MTELDGPTTALVRLAAAIAEGGEGRLGERAAELVGSGAPQLWGDELLLQSILMVGYPRALIAAHWWRLATGQPAVAGEDAADEFLLAEWRRRGEATCRVVYGANYDKLRRNVASLHPAIDAWMVTEGYGRTIGRPGLDLVRRELCIIAQVTVLRAERQLHSHLRGALHAGATRALVESTIDALRADIGAAGVEFARRVWEKVTE